jgi:hypothetical protein
MPNLRDQGTRSGTFHADLQQLKSLAPTLGGLAVDAAQLRSESSLRAKAIFGDVGGLEPAVAAARTIHDELVDAALLPSVKERLAETGEIMTHVAETYRAADDDKKLAEAGAAYTNATGDWDVPEAPKWP